MEHILVVVVIPALRFCFAFFRWWYIFVHFSSVYGVWIVSYMPYFFLCVMHVASCLVVFSICFLHENWREIDRFSFTELFWTVLNIWNLSRGEFSPPCEEFKFSLLYLANYSLPLLLLLSCFLKTCPERIVQYSNCSSSRSVLLFTKRKTFVYLCVWFASTNNNCTLSSCFSCSVVKLVDDLSKIGVWTMFMWPYQPLFGIEYSRTWCSK